MNINVVYLLIIYLPMSVQRFITIEGCKVSIEELNVDNQEQRALIMKSFKKYKVYGLKIDANKKYFSMLIRINIRCNKIDNNQYAYNLFQRGLLPYIRLCEAPITWRLENCIYQNSMLVSDASPPYDVYWVFNIPSYKEAYKLVLNICDRDLCSQYFFKAFDNGFMKYKNISRPYSYFENVGVIAEPNYIPQYTNFQLFGPVGKSDFLISVNYTNNSIIASTYNETFREAPGNPCNCPTTINKKIILCAQIIIGLNQNGISFMQKYIDYIYKINAEKIMNSQFSNLCINKMQMSSAYDYYTVFFYGACQHSLTAWYFTTDIPPPVMNAPVIYLETLYSPEGPLKSPCYIFRKSKSCEIIDLLFFKIRHSKNLLLLTHTTTNGDQYYVFMKIENFITNPYWKVVNSFRNKVQSSNETVIHVTNDLVGNETVVFKGIKYQSMLGNYVYIWGSHLLYSIDGAKNVFIMPKIFNGEIFSFDFISSGFVIFLTTLNELWISDYGSINFKKIFPSTAASYALNLASQQLTPIDINDYSIKMTIENSLDVSKRILITESSNGSIGYFDLPIIKIIESINFIPPENRLAQEFLIEDSCIYFQIIIFMPSYLAYDNVADYFFEYIFPTVTNKGISYTKLTNQDDLYFNTALFGLLYDSLNYNYSLQKVIFSLKKYKDHSSIFSSSMFGRYLSLNGILNDFEVYIDSKNYDPIRSGDQYISTTLPLKIYIYSTRVIIQFYAQFMEASEIFLKTLFANVDIDVNFDTQFLNFALKKELIYHNLTILFTLTLYDAKTFFRQSLPGKDFIASYLSVTFTQSDFFCFTNKESKRVKMGHYFSTILIGCQQSMLVQFDPVRTKEYIPEHKRFKCSDDTPTLQCFDSTLVFRPYFGWASINDIIYNGNFTLLVIGYTENINKTPFLFSDQEIIDNNNAIYGNSWSRIWHPRFYSVVDPISGWPVYNQKNHTSNEIIWTCLPASPCSNIWQEIGADKADIYLLIQFSNALVPDNTTRCNFTFKFWIRLYNAPYGPLKQMLPIFFMSSGVLLHVLFMLYLYINP